MNFRRLDPPNGLRNIIDCYWIAEDNDPTSVLQKIIPDGFPEVIFHFGDPYRINLGSQWERQSASLLAGQITRHFFLENTGRSSMLGLKFRPTALASLFNISMDTITDQVVELSTHSRELAILDTAIRQATDFETRLTLVDNYLQKFPATAQTVVEAAVNRIFETCGTISITTLVTELGVSERQLERLFKKFVGMTPKFYARIIRFSHIFQNNAGKQSWAQLGLETGFYDQSHFIKDFKAFTGEDPSMYFFDDVNLANFFMKK